MLDAVSTGLHPSAVVAQLAGKFGVSERCLWSDWQRRSKWVPLALGLEKYAEFADAVEQGLNAVQKAAWTVYLNASNDSDRVGAPRTVLEALEIPSSIVETRASLSICKGQRYPQEPTFFLRKKEFLFQYAAFIATSSAEPH